MSVVSGVAGKVNGIHSVRNWSIDIPGDPKEMTHSGAPGAKQRVAGNGDWSGKYQIYGYLPTDMPGDAISFAGAISGEGASAVGYAGDALVESVEININVESADPITCTVTFQSNGELTRGTVTVAADTLVQSDFSPIGLKVEAWSTASTPAKEYGFDDLRTATLKLSKTLHAYNSTATDGITQRVAGTLDVALDITAYFADPSELPAENTVHELRVYCTDALYWQIKWMYVGGVSGVEVDAETGALVSAGVSFLFTGTTLVGSTPTVGVIKTPESSPVTIWPES